MAGQNTWRRRHDDGRRFKVQGIPVRVGKYDILPPPTNSKFQPAYDRIDEQIEILRNQGYDFSTPEIIQEDIWDRMDELEYVKEKLQKTEKEEKERIQEEKEQERRMAMIKIPGVDKVYPSSHKFIDPTTTAIPTYDNLLANPAYHIANKNISYDIVYMTEREYMQGCVNNRLVMERRDSASISSEYRAVSAEQAQEYADMMSNGTRFPMPILNYVYGGQEGRHRAVALGSLGVERFPVMVIRRPRKDELPPPIHTDNWRKSEKYKEWKIRTNKKFKEKYSL